MNYTVKASPALAMTGIGIETSWYVATGAALIFGGIALLTLVRRRKHARP